MSSTLSDVNTDLFRPVGELVDELENMSVIPGSLCMECGGSGDTRMLTTKIPYFREIILCSFCCDDCGETNNEVTFGGEIQEKGVRYELEVLSAEDLNRSMIKADTATVRLPCLDFEIPARSQVGGGVSTVEGVLTKAAENLGMYQAERMAADAEMGGKVAQVIGRLALLSRGLELPFTLVVDDPSGNSFVENKRAPMADPQLKVKHYVRTPLQDLAVGLQPSGAARAELGGAKHSGLVDDANAAHGAAQASTFDGARAMFQRFGTGQVGDAGSAAAAAGASTTAADPAAGCSGGAVGGYHADGSADMNEELSSSLGRREILRLPTPCPNCLTGGESLTCFADIPHFKEMIIMAFDCSECGYRSNEVKGGGGVPAQGQTFTLLVQGEEDLARDVLKSGSCDVLIPELDLEASQHSLGGVFTTVEGLLTKVHKAMLESTPYMMGDSAQDSDRTSAFRNFSDRFEAYASGRAFPFTLTLRDPLANSFIGPRLGADPEKDTQMTVSDYARTWDEDEEYGLHDIDTQGCDDGGDESKGGEGNAPNPNRSLVHKRWGPDHPHAFAKGCADDTQPTPIDQPGGGGDWATKDAPEGAAAAAEAAAAAAAAAAFDARRWSGAATSLYSATNDFKAEAFEDANARDKDKATANAGKAAAEEAAAEEAAAEEAAAEEAAAERAGRFEAAATFEGARAGMVFKAGARGLGYYADMGAGGATAEGL